MEWDTLSSIKYGLEHVARELWSKGLKNEAEELGVLIADVCELRLNYLDQVGV